MLAVPTAGAGDGCSGKRRRAMLREIWGVCLGLQWVSAAVFGDTLTRLGLVSAPWGADPPHHPVSTPTPPSGRWVLPPALAPTGCCCPQPSSLLCAPAGGMRVSTSKFGGETQPSSTHGPDTRLMLPPPPGVPTWAPPWEMGLRGSPCAPPAPSYPPPGGGDAHPTNDPNPLTTPPPASQQPQALIIVNQAPPKKEPRGRGVPRGSGARQTKQTQP